MNITFEPGLATTRKLRALRTGPEGAGFLMNRVADDLVDRLLAVDRTFENAVLVHCLTDAASEAVIRSGKAARIERIESHGLLLGEDAGRIADGETIPLEPESIDLAISLLTLHETNDTPGMIIQMRRALKPDGLFIGAMAGAGTLAELRESLLEAEAELSGGASPRVYPLPDIRDAGALLQRAGLALPVTDVETYTVRYATMFDLMGDLRAMGATSALAGRSRKPTTRELFRRAAEIYAEKFSDPDGRIRATFSILWMSGWAPHASQQVPLKPGSAKSSLAEALKAAEDDR